MNQALKDAVYNKGTLRQVNFMAAVGGMNEEETGILNQLKNKEKTLKFGSVKPFFKVFFGRSGGS